MMNIIMTELSSSLALSPLAMGSTLPGNEIQSPMAQVMLGGLVTSTLLNLVVIPIIAPIPTAVQPVAVAAEPADGQADSSSTI